jgi:hypothetical protein
VQVRIRADDEDVVLGVVAPEVAERPGHGQKWHLFDVGGSPDGALVIGGRSVPGSRE